MRTWFVQNNFSAVNTMGGDISLKEEILALYSEPGIGASYGNTYGEENMLSLVRKYRSLELEDMQRMLVIIIEYSRSLELAVSYVSVGVLHALNMSGEVEQAYEWARSLEDSASRIHHFDIGKSLAEYFVAEHLHPLGND